MTTSTRGCLDVSDITEQKVRETHKLTFSRLQICPPEGAAQFCSPLLKLQLQVCLLYFLVFVFQWYHFRDKPRLNEYWKPWTTSSRYFSLSGTEFWMSTHSSVTSSLIVSPQTSLIELLVFNSLPQWFEGDQLGKGDVTHSCKAAVHLKSINQPGSLHKVHQ